MNWPRWEGLADWRRSQRGVLWRMDGPPTRAFRSAVAMCARWGVRVVFGPLEGSAVTRALGRPADWVIDTLRTTAPQSRSWLWWDRSLVVWDDALTDYMAGNLLHELSHAVLPDSPLAVDEVHGAFLWLEYALQRACRVPRTPVMEGYILDDHVEWQELSTREKSRYLEDSLEEARAVGVATLAGKLSYRNLSPGCPQAKRGGAHASEEWLRSSLTSV